MAGLVWSAAASASAFLEPPGAGLVITEFSASSIGRFYDSNGRLLPATSYRKFEVSSYVEYGLVPRLALIFQPSGDAIRTGGPTPAQDRQARLRAAAERLAAADGDRLRAAVASDLAAFWRVADVQAGDSALTRALRFNLLQLRQSAPHDGSGGLAAKGLTGEGYEGHVFWDSEAFALPVLALTAPERALSQLRFRAAALAQARAHARELNFATGALYPWRTIAGDEGSAYFPSGSAQLHLNADIAWAVRLYDRATGDDAFVLGEAAEMVWETARIWLEAGSFAPRLGGAFRICGVTGPDEYSAIVDDDHFTNRMARLHLRYALELAERAGAGAAGAPCAEERAAWARAADAMHLPVDAQLGVHPQDAVFLDKPEWRFREDEADRPLLLHHHPLTLYRHQVLKQASVVQAHAMDPAGAGRAQKRRDLAYYEPRTAHDSTLSAAPHAVVAAAVGRHGRAIAFLRESALVDLDDLHGNAAHGLHMAAMAGGWQALAMGFAGLAVTAGGALAFLPQAPAQMPRYGFGLRWRGADLRVEVDGGEAAYGLAAG
ncbi:MAG: glycoside hydrolase family 65 protein, partial [Caulobacteraceae bacterium]|nr:glycoside hydrolase family 65 protein [Caulobacter sp.]